MSKNIYKRSSYKWTVVFTCEQFVLGLTLVADPDHYQLLWLLISTQYFPELLVRWDLGV